MKTLLVVALESLDLLQWSLWKVAYGFQPSRFKSEKIQQRASVKPNN